jgi:hypothetical protein
MNDSTLAACIAMSLVVTACKKTIPWEQLRNEHCSAISDLRATTRSNVAEFEAALSLFRPRGSDATDDDKWIYQYRCMELERDVRDLGRRIDGFITAGRAIVAARAESDLAAAGLSDRFEDGMMTMPLAFFQSCSQDTSPQAAGAALQTAGAAVDADFEDAIAKCRAAGWSGSR